MTKIINIKTGIEKEIPTFNCNICDCKFTEEEGGVTNGVFGVLPVSFCPTCLSGMFSMVEYFKGEEMTKKEILERIQNVLNQDVDTESGDLDLLRHDLENDIIGSSDDE